MWFFLIKYKAESICKWPILFYFNKIVRPQCKMQKASASFCWTLSHPSPLTRLHFAHLFKGVQLPDL